MYWITNAKNSWKGIAKISRGSMLPVEIIRCFRQKILIHNDVAIDTRIKDAH